MRLSFIPLSVFTEYLPFSKELSILEKKIFKSQKNNVTQSVVVNIKTSTEIKCSEMFVTVWLVNALIKQDIEQLRTADLYDTSHMV